MKYYLPWREGGFNNDNGLGGGVLTNVFIL